MVLKKDAFLTMLKSIDPTMEAAALSLVSPKNPGEDDGDIVFNGTIGDVTLKMEGNILRVLCKKLCDNEVCVAQILFDYEDEEWNTKDTKSVANEIADCVAGYFKTPLVYDTAESKKAKNDKVKTDVDAEREDAIAKKKSKKESVVTYEAENLAHRMEIIYPDIKGMLDANTERYEVFLPEEYFENIATPLIINTIRSGDHQTLKKVFSAFNIFYEEGPKDVQSLIAVSILGMNFVKEPELLEKSEKYMNEDLKDAVEPIIAYLKTSSGKKKVREFHEPKPYKAKK